MTIETRLTEIKKRNKCVCDARFSGIDEAEYRARGCPSCECAHLTDVPMLLEMVEFCKQRYLNCDLHLEKIAEKYNG